VHNSLAVVENIVEFRPAVCKDAASAGLMAWLVKKLKVKVPFDANKLYASEILSILLQNEPENRSVLQHNTYRHSVSDFPDRHL
jgi:beta-catenin-like protein 1